jgi:hypothetical protein
MVTLFVGGKVVRWADAETLFAEAAPTQAIEFRNAAGRVIAVSAPADDPDWVKAITPEETARRMAGPFLTLEEYRRQVGE